MTEKQINEQLVEDVVRILTVANAWKDEKPQSRTCKDREQRIAKKMNDGEEAELYAQISEILQECNGRSYRNILSKYYIKNAMTLLRYRIEEKASEASSITLLKERYDLSKYCDAVIQELRHAKETVLGYRAYELSGSLSALKEALRAYGVTGDISLRIEYVSDPGTVYREKCPYLTHKIWETTQLLPIIVVTKEGE